jgi:PAS domain S-box-containing protein
MGCQKFSDHSFHAFLTPLTLYLLPSLQWNHESANSVFASLHNTCCIPGRMARRRLDQGQSDNMMGQAITSGLGRKPDGSRAAIPTTDNSESRKTSVRRVVKMPARAFSPAPLSNRLIVSPESNSGEIVGAPNAEPIWRLERVWEERNRTPTLLASGAIILIVALADWWTKPFVAFGVLYLFPIMLAAGFLPRWVIGLLGAACAALSETFSSLDRSTVRLGFETLALVGCGLFVAELVRNRRLTLDGQERLKALVETSPAAIVTLDERGLIELANRAAVELMGPRDGKLAGSPIAAFLPDLHHALRWEEGPQFRASMQCRGHRGNGESFTADVWFSTYKEGATPKLAAIIADVTGATVASDSDVWQSEHPARVQLSNREMDVLRSLVQGLANKEMATRMEVSESTIKNTLQQLFAKINVRTRAQLIREALEQYRDLLSS